MKKILIIDDQKDNVYILKTRLEIEGFKVITADDGQKGIEKAIEFLPNLILLDVMMPGISGFEVCKYLTEHKETQLIPIILVTALPDVEDVRKGLDSGAIDYIKKPFNRVELIARINSALRYNELLKNANTKLNVIENKENQTTQIKSDSIVNIDLSDNKIDESKKHLEVNLSGVVLDKPNTEVVINDNILATNQVNYYQEIEKNYEIIIEGSFRILKLNYKRLTFTIATEFKNIIDGLLKETQRVIIFLNNTQYMDSTILGVLIFALKTLKRDGGFLKIVCDENLKYTLFSVNGMDKIFDIYPTILEAKKSMIQ